MERATVPLLSFGGVVVAGILGFVLMADVGMVEATFWILDLASIELHFQDHGGPERAVKAYAILVRLGIVLTGVWIGETVLSAAFGGQIQEELQTVRTQRNIEDLSDHVIICGYGIFGRTIAARLRESGEDVVAVESDASVFGTIDDDMLAIEGDARSEDVLRDAGIERARAVVAAIDDSNANIQIAITGSQIAPSVKMIVRVGDEMYESVARRAGADQVVIPEVVSGERVTEAIGRQD